MSLPEPDRTLLAAPPLLAMLCQVRYDACADLASGAAAQTLLKRVTPLGLGSMIQIHQQQLVMIAGPAVDHPSLESPPQAAGWQFANESSSTTLHVLTDQMTLETRVYPGWVKFRSMWDECLDALTAASNPAVSTRVGLRYVNRVTSSRARSLTEFHSADLVDHTFLGPISGSALSAYVTATEGRETLRFPDGNEALVQHGVVSGSPGPALILDIDCFRSEAAEFDKRSLRETAASLNDHALQIFQTVVRPSLQEEMKQGGTES